MCITVAGAMRAACSALVVAALVLAHAAPAEGAPTVVACVGHGHDCTHSSWENPALAQDDDDTTLYKCCDATQLQPIIEGHLECQKGNVTDGDAPPTVGTCGNITTGRPPSPPPPPPSRNSGNAFSAAPESRPLVFALSAAAAAAAFAADGAGPARGGGALRFLLPTLALLLLAGGVGAVETCPETPTCTDAEAISVLGEKFQNNWDTCMDIGALENSANIAQAGVGAVTQFMTCDRATEVTDGDCLCREDVVRALVDVFIAKIQTEFGKPRGFFDEDFAPGITHAAVFQTFFEPILVTRAFQMGVDYSQVYSSPDDAVIFASVDLSGFGPTNEIPAGDGGAGASDDGADVSADDEADEEDAAEDAGGSGDGGSSDSAIGLPLGLGLGLGILALAVGGIVAHRATTSGTNADGNKGSLS